MNTLYFGDCLDVLKDLHHEYPKGFIDLVYIDPPFNSKRDYNILFEDVDMKDATAQKQAFADTWSNVSYVDTLKELQETDLDLYNFLTALDNINIPKSAVAYLTTMAIRILYIHKVLKDTGSFYLHCDPTMSHYLKLVCDLVFGESNYRNEITWKRNFTKKGSQHKMTRFANNIDIILFYTKSDKYYFVTPKIKSETEDLTIRYDKVDENGRRFKSEPIELPKMMARENLKFEYKGYTPEHGWMMNREKLEQLDLENKIYFTSGGKPRRKNYMDDYSGSEVDNLWDDILPIGQKHSEGLGYPTQKPEALLERILIASSKEGDLVADFFCGCGTTIAAAQRLKRDWFGVDISHLAVGLIKRRLIAPYKEHTDKRRELLESIVIKGIPRDIASAKELAQNTEGGRLGFQDWIIEVMIGGVCNPKRTADGGWDGHITFEINDKKHTVIIEVKSGNVNVKNVREFIQVVEKQNADMGVFVCFAEQVTKPMLSEAKHAGYFEMEKQKTKYDKMQIITVEDLLEGDNIKMPYSTKTTFKKSSKSLESEAKQEGLFN